MSLPGLAVYSSSSSSSQTASPSPSLSPSPSASPSRPSNNTAEESCASAPRLQRGHQTRKVAGGTASCSCKRPAEATGKEGTGSEGSTKRTKQADAGLYAGRVRSVPHVRGNWATYVYAEVVPTPSFLDVVRRIVDVANTLVAKPGTVVSLLDSGARDEDELSGDELGQPAASPAGPSTLHVSLTRCLFLKTFHIERFVCAIKRELCGIKTFPLSFTHVEHLSNDEQTRSFLAFAVGAGVSELTACLEAVDQEVQKFNFTKFHEVPRFHASIASARGGSTIGAFLSENRAIADLAERELSRHVFTVRRIVCQTGNKIHPIELE